MSSTSLILLSMDLSFFQDQHFVAPTKRSLNQRLEKGVLAPRFVSVAAKPPIPNCGPSAAQHMRRDEKRLRSDLKQKGSWKLGSIPGVFVWGFWWVELRLKVIWWGWRLWCLFEGEECWFWEICCFFVGMWLEVWVAETSLTELELGTLTDRKAIYCALYIVFFPERGIGIVAERTERTPITYCPRNTAQWRIQHVNLLGRFFRIVTGLQPSDSWTPLGCWWFTLSPIILEVLEMPATGKTPLVSLRFRVNFRTPCNQLQVWCYRLAWLITSGTEGGIGVKILNSHLTV